MFVSTTSLSPIVLCVYEVCFKSFLLRERILFLIGIPLANIGSQQSWQLFTRVFCMSRACILSALHRFPRFKGGEEQARELNLLEDWGREW